MAKWFFLFFVVALAASGWWASRDGASAWAPAAPTLVLAAGVVTGLGYAIRYGLRRRKEMAAVAARADMSFTKEMPVARFRELGLGALKLFVYCRPADELSLLERSVRPHFGNVMSSRESGAELYVFDYATSTRSGGPSERGTFACFRTPGAALPDLEIVPRLWGERPEWLQGLTESPPTRAAFELGDAGFDAEYRADAADEAPAREILTGELSRFLTIPDATGWRIEMSGEWMSVTRLTPTKNFGGPSEPMTPEELPRELRRSYFEHPIDPARVPAFIEIARRLHRIVRDRALKVG